MRNTLSEALFNRSGGLFNDNNNNIFYVYRDVTNNCLKKDSLYSIKL